MNNKLGDRPVFLIIDMQHDFVDKNAPFPCVGVEQMIPRLKKVLQAARNSGRPVIYVREAHRLDLSDIGRESDPWHPRHCVEGTRGAEIIEELKPESTDHVKVKRRWTAFFNTDLDLLLKGLNADTLVQAGVATNACILYTAYSGWERDYRIRIIHDCTAAGSEEEVRYGLAAIEYFQADVKISAAELIDTLKAFNSNDSERLTPA
jgi:nicotinamidase-related amidase